MYVRNLLVILFGIHFLLLIGVDLHLAVYRFYARGLYVCLLEVRTPYYTTLGRESATYSIIIIIIIITNIIIIILTLRTMCAN